MNMSDSAPHFLFLIVLVYWVVILAAIVWGFYIAYLLTRALRKYLRS